MHDEEEMTFSLDESPEMQVIFNTSTPVQQRRKLASQKSNGRHRRISSDNIQQTRISSKDNLRNLLENCNLPKCSNQASLTVGYRDKLPFTDGQSGLSLLHSDHCCLREEGKEMVKNPFYAGTWHGSTLPSGRLLAPRMGASIRPTADTPSLDGVRRFCMTRQTYDMHARTLPSISRTLLDAFHRRHCGYQYVAGRPRPTQSSSVSPSAGISNTCQLSSAHCQASVTENSNSVEFLPRMQGANEDSSVLPPVIAPSEQQSYSKACKQHLRAVSKNAFRSHLCHKLNSEGESDSCSSATNSTLSSPGNLRTGPAGNLKGATGGLGHTSHVSGHSHRSETSDYTASSSSLTPRQPDAEKELVAQTACQWLRNAGFPQYAQMFEDGFFPVNVSEVVGDHDFLGTDFIKSAIRRLDILNRCSAIMKVQELSNKTTGDDSDDDDVAALSDRWAYQKSVRRWARKSSDATSHDAETSHHDLPPHDIQQEVPVMTITVEETRQCQGLPHRTANRALTAEVPVKLLDGGPLTGTQEEVDVGFQHVPDTPKLLRVATDRLKGVFRMNSFRKKTSKPSTKINVFEIGDPVISNLDFMQAKLKTLNCVDLVTKDQVIVSSTSPSLMSPTSRPVESSVKCVSGSATTAKCRCASEISRSHSCSEFRSATRCLPSAEFQSPAHDGNKPQTTARVTVSKNIDSSLVEVFLLPQDHKPGSFPRLLRNGFVDTTPPTTTPQYSLTPTPKALCIRPQACREIDTCMSVYDNCSLPPGKRVGPRRPPRTADPVPGDSPWTPALPCDSELGVASNSRLTDVTSPLNTYKVGMVESNSMGLGGKTVSCPPSFSSLLPVSVSNSRLHPIPSRAANCDTSETTLIMAEFDRVLQDLYRDIDSLDQFTKGHKVDDPPPSSQSAGILFPDGHCHYNSFCYQRVVDSSTSDANLSCSTLNGDFSRTSHSETESLPGCVEDSVDDCLDVGGCSRTTSSFESGDDVTKRTGTDDLDGAVNGARERRDSGVGLSLTRNSRERKKKIRWESFQKRHCPCSSGQDVSTGCLTVWQVSRLRQLAFLKVTSVMEGGSSPSQALHWPWVMPRFMKRHKTSHCCNRRVFGVPLIVTCQRTGQPLPQCILAAMRHLRKSCREAVGIFRKSGVRSRIKKLRHFVEENSDCVDFDHLQAYDVADLLKQFFRELPECLLSNKLSDTFRTIFTQVSEVDRLDTLRSTIALLPEENQEVLHCLLFFLQDISQHADEHQMSARNLAVCFAPSLFSFPGSHNMSSPRQPRKNHRVSEQIELLEQRGTHECFTFMISDCQQLFKVSLSMYECLQLTAASCNLEPVPLSEFYSPADHRGPNFKVFGEEQIQAALKDVHDKNNSRCWVAMPTSAPGVEVAWCKLNDGHPLRQWKCCVEIDASPVEVLTRILHQRHTWDYDLLSCSVAEKLDKHSDIFCYTVSTMPPHPAREFTVLRYWRPDLANGACAVVSTSVAYSSSLDGKGSGGAVIAVDLGTSYHVEASGSGRRCRLTYITRVDLRGRSADWYNRCFGHFCCNFIDRFRASFQQDWNDPSSTITSMTGTTRPPP